ncbi:MAG TPA: hypothetical protein PLA27_17335 [Anaerolineales bacterium]|nr:hypothetical protein [Anaerolineales bacterium]
MIESLLKPVLVLLLGYLLRLGLVAIGVQLDEAVFNSIVAAIAAYLLALLGLEGGVRAVGVFKKK